MALILIQLIAQSFTGNVEKYSELWCAVFERLTSVWPSSPYTLQDLADQLAENVPEVGGLLIYECFSDAFQILSLCAGYKLIKIIPGRF